MMRIEPDRNTVPALRPTASAAASATASFASALSEARNSRDPSLPAATDLSHVGETPLAEQWGKYGDGATAEGYTPPPDLASLADVPIGPNEPANPLNPSGVTSTPGFTVDGYTGRGTPIPPGFYNLAYYNWYLRDGGTPLPGFPALEDGATITGTYGTFGDGRERATSFATAAGAGSASAGAIGTITSDAGSDAASAESAPQAAAAGVLAAPAAAARPTTAAPSAASAPETSAAVATKSVPSTSGPASTASAAAATGAAVSAPTNDLEATIRADLTSLLRDLLGAA